MRLTIAERLNILPILPDKGKIDRVRAIRECQEALSLTAKEMKHFEVMPDNRGNIQWNSTIDQDTCVDLTAGAFALIAEELVKLEQKGEGELPVQLGTAFEKFCVDPVTRALAEPVTRAKKRREKKGLKLVE